MKYIISVSKTYKHRDRFITHKPKTKKHWQIMYYDIDEDTKDLVLQSKFVNTLQAFYYKFKKYYKRKFVCTECGYVFEMLVKKRQHNIDVDCPNCEE
tara:strand:- start:85 stop:375 length:291 start_codon:yes stop_codon:yes gene_type:complete